MKRTILKFSFILLLPIVVGISLIGAGCEKEDSYEEISLEYSKCPCDHETNFIKEVEIENVLLFDASKISFSEMKNLSFDGERSLFVSYSSETDSAVFYSFTGAIVGISYFCNFPSIDKKWEISPNGIYISFSADEFELCNPKISIGTYTYSNLILTSLKKHLK